MEIERINEHTVKFIFPTVISKTAGLTEKKFGTIENAVKSFLGNDGRSARRRRVCR